MYCGYCGSNLHTVKNCPKTWSGSSNRSHMRCTYCGGTDHNVKACPKTWGGSSAMAWHQRTVEDHFVKDK